MSERLACKAVGLARSTYRRLPLAATLADPDADLRAWLRAYASKHPCHGFRRAWAALRHDEGRGINVKKVHRLWCEEGLQVRVHSPRKRAGTSSVPEVIADAPNGVTNMLDADTEGVVVTELGDDSTAANVGFQKGDIILAVNNQKIAKTSDLEKATRESARLWRITVVRGGQQINVTLGG